MTTSGLDSMMTWLLLVSTVVAVNDAGAIRYFGNRTTIDLMGLNDHQTLREDPRRDLSRLLARGADCFIVFPAWFPELQQALPVREVHRVRATNYTVVPGAQDEVVVYRLEGRQR